MSMKIISSLFGLGIFCLLLFIAPGVWSAEKDSNHENQAQHEMQQDRERFSERDVDYERLRNEKPIFGWHLMSPAERLAHRQRLLSLRTQEEREAFQRQHRERMKKRAEGMGVELKESTE